MNVFLVKLLQDGQVHGARNAMFDDFDVHWRADEGLCSGVGRRLSPSSSRFHLSVGSARGPDRRCAAPPSSTSADSVKTLSEGRARGLVAEPD